MTTDERAGFLTAILSDPADDTARGAYADALRESDDAFDLLHGAFIWSGLTLARYRGMEPADDGMFFDAIKEQTEAADRVLPVQIKALLGAGWPWDRCVWTNDDAAPDRVTVGLVPIAVGEEPVAVRRARRRNASRNQAVVYERGCVCGLRVTLAVWTECAARVLTHCPLERVEVLDVPGLVIAIEKSTDGVAWWFRGELDVPRVGGIGGPQLMGPLTNRRPPLERFRRDRPAYGATRAYLIEHHYALTAALVNDLRDLAGDRWPGVPSISVTETV